STIGHDSSFGRDNLPPGTYTVNAAYSINGSTYQAHREGVDVTAGQTTDINLVVALDGSTVSPSALTDPNGGGQQTCDAGNFSWAVCPLIDLTAKAVNSIENDLIKPLLNSTPLPPNPSKTDPTFPIHEIWQVFVYLADSFFVLVFFVIIF